MNPLMTMSLAEMHREALLIEADKGRLARQAGRSARGGLRDAMRRLTVSLAVRAHLPHAAGG